METEIEGDSAVSALSCNSFKFMGIIKEVTRGKRSNQLNYVPTRQINKMRNNQCLCGVARIANHAWSCLYCQKERDSCPNRPPQISPGRDDRRDLSSSSALKYPNSFLQNTKELGVCAALFDESLQPSGRRTGLGLPDR